MQLTEHQYTYTFDWFSNHIPLWQALLERYQGKDNLRFLEIGSFEGRSAIWLLEKILTAPSSQLTCVDVFQTLQLQGKEVDCWKHFTENTAPFKEKVVIKKGFSRIILQTLPKNHYDFIYIDGSHQAMDVLEDSVRAFPLLKNQGILLWDDYWYGLAGNLMSLSPINQINRHLPKPAIDLFLEMYCYKYQFLYFSNQVAIKKLCN